MEHNVEKIIRDKVNAQEEAPIIWKKEFVWSEISSATKSQSRSNWFYRVAASLVLIISVFSLSEVFKQNQLDARLRLLEAGINRLMNSNTSSDQLVSEKIEADCIDKAATIISPKKSDKKTALVITTKTDNYGLDHREVDESDKLDADVAIETPLISSISMNEATTKQNKKKVHAVFSAATNPTPISASKINKKINLRLFKQEEETGSDLILREPINLTARINKK